MPIKFGGHCFPSFGDISTFKFGLMSLSDHGLIPLPSKMAKFPFLTMDYSPWSSKSLIDRNRLKTIMQIRIDELCMCTNFGGRDLSGFGDITTLKNGQNSLSDHGL